MREMLVPTRSVISIHALLAESDGLYDTYAKVLRVFLSTLSLRRATWDLMGGLSCNAYFYPRSPCGERLCFDSNELNSSYFYPRSPCGERLG